MSATASSARDQGDEFEVRLDDVGKSYGTSRVLRQVDLTLRTGECTTLVGENGAGKSTLVNILSGRIRPSEGSMRIDGVLAELNSIKDARSRGIAVIPQELAGLPDLSVAENIMLANLPRRRWHVSKGWMGRRASEELAKLGIELDVSRPLRDLTLADRQLVEIAKALATRARLLILDEPTASLHAAEAANLLERLHALKDSGTSLVYVSHHLDECLDISDHVVVLRNGEVVSRGETSDTTPSRVVELMLGREYVEPEHRRKGSAGSVVISLHSWSRRRQPAIKDVSIEVRSGEVLGIFGLVGSGAETVARALGAQDTDVAGSISVHGGTQRSTPRSSRDATSMGIGYVPAERKVDGLALSQSVAANVVMTDMRAASRRGVFSKRRSSSIATEQARIFGISCRSVAQPIGELSGGNQQKALLASRVAAAPSILVLHEPTRGVDVGARSQIHQHLADFADRGGAVVIVTSDLQEAVAATDRLLVMRDGSVCAELTGADKTVSSSMAIASGAVS